MSHFINISLLSLLCFLISPLQGLAQGDQGQESEPGAVSQEVPEAPDDRIRVYEVKGPPLVKVQRGKQTLSLKKGSVLMPGDKIMTDPGQTVKFQLSHGMVLAVAEKSEFKITLSGNAERSTQLIKGQYRGKVEKIPGIPETRRKRHRLLIQTKTAVMGVRGTDFVTTAMESGTSQFHTLEGVVDVAPSEQSLVSGQKVTELNVGQKVAAGAEAIGQPSTFNINEFASNLGELSGQPGGEPVIFQKVAEPLAQASPSAMPGLGLGTGTAVSPAPLAKDDEKKSEVEKEKTKAEEQRRMRLLNFEVAYNVALKRTDMGSTGGGGDTTLDRQRGLGISWNPQFRLIGERLSLRPHIGYIFFEENEDGETKGVNTPELKAMLELKILGLLIAAGPMVRKWDNEEFRAGIAVNVGLHLGIFFIDRVFVGAGKALGVTANDLQFVEGHVGVGLSF